MITQKNKDYVKKIIQTDIFKNGFSGRTVIDSDFNSNSEYTDFFSYIKSLPLNYEIKIHKRYNATDINIK